MIAAPIADGLVGVHALAGRLAHELGDRRLHERHARLPADEQDLVDLRLRRCRPRRGCARRSATVRSTRSSVSCSSFSRVISRSTSSGPVRRPSRCTGCGSARSCVDGQLDLGGLGRVADALRRARDRTRGRRRAARRNSSQHVLHHAIVEVDAAEERVAAGGDDLEDAVLDVDDRDVERAAAEVVHRDALVEVLAEAVGERRGGGLVQDAEHLEPGELAGRAHGLALPVVEVGGDGDDRLIDLVAERTPPRLP